MITTLENLNSKVKSNASLRVAASTDLHFMQPSPLTYLLLEHLPHVGISVPCTHLAQNHECYDLFSTSLNTTTINNEVVHRGTHHDTQTHKYRFYFEKGWVFCSLGVKLALHFFIFVFLGEGRVAPDVRRGGGESEPHLAVMAIG